jgi:hypothetical protein
MGGSPLVLSVGGCSSMEGVFHNSLPLGKASLVFLRGIKMSSFGFVLRAGCYASGEKSFTRMISQQLGRIMVQAPYIS